ncbi:MAG: bifunctional diguanylate cyclase/phosphodiesterase, partial [Ruminococcus sp.]|nr:bifunctional diguanylate cyclase/phosphodiesterase [Ruminococcus sp.]
MNFQEFADSFHAPTGILSVRRTADGGYGDIRIVTGNAKYLEPIEHPTMPSAPEMLGLPEVFHSSVTFVPNSPYERYLPKDVGFEDIIYRAAVRKTPVHTFVHINALNLWFDIFAMPIDFENGDICYCTYTARPSSPAEVGVSSNSSETSSEDVIKTCIKLHSTDDFVSAIEDIIGDIRLLCMADVCTLMLVDTSRDTFDVVATSISENCGVQRVTKFPNFKDIASSWLDTLESTDCLVIKDKNDLELIRGLNEPWYQNLIDAGVESLIMFPLRYDSEVLGFIWASNFDTTNTMRIKETLELMTFFISSKLSSNKMMERLKRISYTDRLTGIPNRFACDERVDDLIRQGERFALVSIDINSFKSVNETMGFEAGNTVLSEIAARWKAIADSMLMGTRDYIARIGGDEFALIICGAESDADIRETIRMYSASLETRLTIDDCDFYFTASFGYSMYPDDSHSRDKLHSYADAAMQEVKRINSSNHILRFTPELLKSERTHELERKVRAALENDAVYYHLQPQFDIDHKLYGFEALARMKDADGSNISPGEFIPAAEKIGVVDKIDAAVFRKSAMFIGELIKRTGAEINLSVNVSVRHLMKNDFIAEVKEILSESGLPAERLEIEITESIMIESAEKALYCINEIHNMGIRIAIDDFGTGYSALSYLNTFPADTLKIDKSFIDKLNYSESSTQYAAAIISMGHIMGFDVVSEGVEEQQQLETLRSIGCDYIQGFIWGRPM